MQFAPRAITQTFNRYVDEQTSNSGGRKLFGTDELAQELEREQAKRRITREISRDQNTYAQNIFQITLSHISRITKDNIDETSINLKAGENSNETKVLADAEKILQIADDFVESYLKIDQIFRQSNINIDLAIREFFEPISLLTEEYTKNMLERYISSTNPSKSEFLKELLILKNNDGKMAPINEIARAILYNFEQTGTQIKLVGQVSSKSIEALKIEKKFDDAEQSFSSAKIENIYDKLINFIKANFLAIAIRDAEEYL